MEETTKGKIAAIALLLFILVVAGVHLFPDPKLPAVEDAVVKVIGPGWHGSGIIIREDGLIVTAKHCVVDDYYSDYVSSDITVELQDGRIFDAKRIMTDCTEDIAIFDIDCNDLPAAKLADENANSGDFISITGYPFDETMWTARGYIAKLGHRSDIYVDVGAAPGHSGSAIFYNNEIVGILCWGYGDTVICGGESVEAIQVLLAKYRLMYE